VGGFVTGGREYGGERAEGGAEVMEINGNKWEVIVSLTTLLTQRECY
jgi:hypothetical protein